MIEKNFRGVGIMKYLRRVKAKREWPEDIYDEEFRDELLDDDEISAEEEGFMRGYMEDDE